MKNSGPAPQSESSFFSFISILFNWITGADTPNEAAATTSPSDTSSPPNESRKRKLDTVCDEAEALPDSTPKAQAVEQAPSNQEQPIQEQLPDLLNNAFYKGVFKYLSNKNLVSLSASCRQLREWTCIEREKRKLPPLLLAVVQGNESEAKRWLDMNPALLLDHEAKAIDYSERTIEGLTPFQAALCAGDVEMCEMMKPYFTQLENGQAELERQYYEIFPNGIDAHVEEQKKDVFDFATILNAIKNASAVDVQTALDKNFEADTPLNHALKKFRKQFHDKSLSEKIYNPQHLLSALQMYVDEFNNLSTSDKQDLFWRQVTGFVQRYLPACYAQAFATGLYDIVDNNSPLVRSFNFKDGSGAMLPLGCNSGVGFDWVGVGCKICGYSLGSVEWRDALVEAVQNYVLQKHQAFKNYSHRLSGACSNVRP